MRSGKPKRNAQMREQRRQTQQNNICTCFCNLNFEGERPAPRLSTLNRLEPEAPEIFKCKEMVVSVPSKARKWQIF